MTLVELLVVVAILGLLSVVVLPNLANPGDARKVREAARSVSGLVANVQSRAIGTRSGGGLWVEPLQNMVTDSLGMAHVVAIDIFAAQVPEPYAGEALNSFVTVAPAKSGTAAALTFHNDFLLPATLTSSSNMVIRFAGSPTSFRLLPFTGSPTTATMNLGRGQTPYNTAWPVTTSTTGVAYEVLLAAAKDPSAAVTLGDGMAVDLTWTYLGSAGPWGFSPASPPPLQPSQILYDSAGRPADIVRSGGLAEPMIEPVCLLVAPLEMIQEATCFTKGGAYWVAIDPRGGVPRVAEVNLLSGAALDAKNRPADPAALIQSQAFVRQSTFQEGR
jgi:type II secretory pathway pseudopilin PulG